MMSNYSVHYGFFANLYLYFLCCVFRNIHVCICIIYLKNVSH